MERELYCNNQMTTWQMGKFEYNNRNALIGNMIIIPFAMILFGVVCYFWFKNRKWWMIICFWSLFIASIAALILSIIWLIKINQNPYDYFCAYLPL